ncbi:hypothetical protein ABB37_04615 [Leptomonas pyrrhocoris]|uniref:Uncharacterized protein n=1 Tax=Leptomonas pyrrhocoris TaxID=157538 RepID=A0A0M9G1A0_LEPPY|nr:hypothetical protein ABB37_04615 [Leptomonas pyrrhocoris]XP_015658790.1 hypothetical protein ABB37_04615 [Leptomonas pyrrhocoris]KPA80350.1 hypothetical protein ABB37_04615 [Leptomonas pyrrhocoris]KPA80351.1 hypothetical protein ABB37_04615 [Leptomonas pyrrhocoris]|eukprot:XP_015658789.1 hypothetical protein ABB37_04615 [Leptomonas pyrrhocoris]
MDAEPFEEDWQRPPGDVGYLQDLLQSLGGRHQRSAALSAAATDGSSAEGPKKAATAAPAGRPAGYKTSGHDEEDVEVLRMRERQIDVIERRRRRAQRRCDAVDAAFARSVHRRMQAMRHLALDPPAERLVGQGMTQYVPAALLPDDILDAEGRLRPGSLPLLPHSVVETHVQHQLTHGRTNLNPTAAPLQAVTAITDRSARRPNEPDALVFLTQLDAGVAPERETEKGCTVDGASTNNNSGPPQGASSSSAADGGTNARAASPPQTHIGASTPAVEDKAAGTVTDAVEDERREGDDERWMRPSNLTATNKDRWRELGYHVVVVGGGRGAENAAARRAFQSTAAPPEASTSPNAASITRVSPPHQGNPFSSTMSSTPQRSTTTRQRSPPERGAPSEEKALWRWTALAPLPPVCLIQRRLPEEDMTARELRHQQSSSRFTSRRGPAGRGDARHSWKTGSK